MRGAAGAPAVHAAAGRGRGAVAAASAFRNRDSCVRRRGAWQWRPAVAVHGCERRPGLARAVGRWLRSAIRTGGAVAGRAAGGAAAARPGPAAGHRVPCMAARLAAPCGPLLVFGDAELPLPCVPVDACTDAVQALEAACTAVAAAAGPAPSLRLLAYPCLGARRYPSARLASLRPGDVLIAPLQRRHGGYRAWLCCGAASGRQWRLHGHIDRHTFHLEDIADMNTVTASEQVATASAPRSIDQVDVPVQLELDPLLLPLGELGTLQPGHVLELNTCVEDACVQLMVYGQSIGSGRLIAVGDHLGVQLVSVNGRLHADA
ncbi:type III secretion system cytoplasmic ring protein SctQ [Xanthomonas theicola]|uniref:type III secretion system cytoplasmic ring protein SctQ n=1 Tax=Xanthomonas theicola TaxID=56464 RepID=UPI003621A0A1